MWCLFCSLLHSLTQWCSLRPLNRPPLLLPHQQQPLPHALACMIAKLLAPRAFGRGDTLHDTLEDPFGSSCLQRLKKHATGIGVATWRHVSSMDVSWVCMSHNEQICAISVGVSPANTHEAIPHDASQLSIRAVHQRNHTPNHLGNELLLRTCLLLVALASNANSLRNGCVTSYTIEEPPLRAGCGNFQTPSLPFGITWLKSTCCTSHFKSCR